MASVFILFYESVCQQQIRAGAGPSHGVRCPGQESREEWGNSEGNLSSGQDRQAGPLGHREGTGPKGTRRKTISEKSVCKLWEQRMVSWTAELPAAGLGQGQRWLQGQTAGANYPQRAGGTYGVAGAPWPQASGHAASCWNTIRPRSH